MRSLVFLLAASCACASPVTFVRVPNGGIQPQIELRDGVLHMVYFSGAPENGNLFYVRSRDYGATFSKPIPVNHSSDKAVAVGNIRGAQIAVGRNGRVHVVWNGTAPAGRIPLWYTRLNESGDAFEPERNLIGSAYGLDGGSAIAADARGNVYAFWHAPIPGTKGEQNRRIWVVSSGDDGRTFSAERIAFQRDIGVCGCCGMKAFADASGVYALFRSADQIVNRDIWLLSSTDGGRSFNGRLVSKWNIGACVMSAAYFAKTPEGLLGAWETEKQVYFGRVAESGVSDVTAAPGTAQNRKFPVIAANSRGDVLFAWTEGMAWKKPGAIGWEIRDRAGRQVASHLDSAEDVPVWSFIGAFARPDGAFVVVY
jgi:hypothetical protein